MISRPRRLLALLPFIGSLMLCETRADIVPMLVGGCFISIPYLLAWWLSDGFAFIGSANLEENTDAPIDPLSIEHMYGNSWYSSVSPWKYRPEHDPRSPYYSSRKTQNEIYTSRGHHR